VALSNSLLHRYWFALSRGLGIGVTAYSREDAEIMAMRACEASGWGFEVVDVITDVDVRDLDQNHVIPNMGAPNVKGVWFPMLNL
jgi:hypothetical protein